MFLKGRHEDEAKGEIAFRGICGSYLDNMSLMSKDGPIIGPLVYAPQPRNVVQSKCILWPGLSVTLLPPREAAAFLRRLAADGVLTPENTPLIGLDRCRDVEKSKLHVVSVPNAGKHLSGTA